MLNKQEKSKDEPIKPVKPSSQPGTSIKKEPNKPSTRPMRPSENPGTLIPMDEPK